MGVYLCMRGVQECKHVCSTEISIGIHIYPTGGDPPSRVAVSGR